MIDISRQKPGFASQRFSRLAETKRLPVRLLIDGHAVEALAGDTLMVAVLNNIRQLRVSEFGDGKRAGFCLMGAGQDCWVWIAEGKRQRACSTMLALHESFGGLRGKIDYLPETLAWNIADRKLHVTSNEGIGALPYDALVIRAGANVAAVLDTSPFLHRVTALPKLLARPAVPCKGLALVVEVKRVGAQVLTGITPVQIKGSPDAGLGGTVIRDNRGHEQTFDCDTVAMGYQLRPETQLADLARCSFRFDQATRQWLPDVDDGGRTAVPGVYLAGDGMRVFGAGAAEIGGRLAAMALLQDLDLKVQKDELQRLRAQQSRMERFRQAVAQACPSSAASAWGAVRPGIADIRVRKSLRMPPVRQLNKWDACEARRPSSRCRLRCRRNRNERE